MKEYASLFAALEGMGAGIWANKLPGQLADALNSQKHGDLLRWRQAIVDMPALSTASIDLRDDVRIGLEAELTSDQQQVLLAGLKALHPWRKGPYNLFGIYIDTEWRSDWKWDRVKDHIAPLTNRVVLDIGCGNGYHCWRMRGAGARLVVGVDPTLLSVMQFQAVQKFCPDDAVHVLPLGIEDIPPDMRVFDTVFSMGVLYHRRSPIDHLLELKGCLRPGGELVLETLVVEGGVDKVLVPDQRYAQMRNVWFLPSCQALMLWMKRCGFKNIRLVDVTKTSVEEQRSTEWMQFHSLVDFLDPQDNSRTCEGLPAPLRAIIIANVDG